MRIRTWWLWVATVLLVIYISIRKYKDLSLLTDIDPIDVSTRDIRTVKTALSLKEHAATTTNITKVEETTTAATIDFLEPAKMKALRALEDQFTERVARLAAENMRLTRALANVQCDGEEAVKNDASLPVIFGITPTYARLTQKADMTRLSQTLRLVRRFHWVVVEDSTERTSLIGRLLNASGLHYTHMNHRTKEEHQRKRWESHRKHHRGVGQRNTVLAFLRKNWRRILVNEHGADTRLLHPDIADGGVDDPGGAVYFMDDDNAYDVQLFDDVRRTKRVAVWPVGLSGGARWAGPVVQNGKVVRFHTNWKAKERSFPLDMAGFAIGAKYILEDRPTVNFDMYARRGFLEPTFLEELTTINELEPMAENCTKVLVWHTRTEFPKASADGEKNLTRRGRPSDPRIET